MMDQFEDFSVKYPVRVISVAVKDAIYILVLFVL